MQWYETLLLITTQGNKKLNGRKLPKLLDILSAYLENLGNAFAWLTALSLSLVLLQLHSRSN